MLSLHKLNIFVVSRTIQHVRILQVLHSAIVDGRQHRLQPKTDGQNLVENSTFDAGDQGRSTAPEYIH